MVHHQAGSRDMVASTTTTTTYDDFAHRRSVERRTSNETPMVDSLPGGWPHTPGANGGLGGNVKEGLGGSNGSVLSVPNGGNGSDRAPSAKSVALSMRSKRSISNMSVEGDRRSGEVVKENTTRPGVAEEGYFAPVPNGKPPGPPRSPLSKPVGMSTGDMPPMPRSVSHGQPPMTPHSALPPVEESSPQTVTTNGMLKPPKPQHHRASSPPAFNPNTLSPITSRPDRLTHRHTLEVPKVVTRTSKDSGEPSPNLDGSVVSATGRFSPNTPTRRRGSLQLTRRHTRSVNSDLQLDDIPQDEDAARWAEHYRAKRASKKHRADTDDERVVVGTKVDENHVNFETAYNMLTGIRFTVSRTNAKLDRELTDADFQAKHKFSFDVMGTELTPGAKYDFKFKDYAPWVFRHLRADFKIDPAEYLMSLTSKYILSELGSPGKSGSFFYFSRDYKYIIKTIHHGEHKFLRKILKEYYHHVRDNPNTLLSQFYGLHRVKIPYGRKIHFVVMNNLFPPHRDIHRTFDLKGSTIGRDFKEEDLEKNPRATLKDLNWLRRNLHLEFGPTKKDAFVKQMQRDVELLQRLKIMDYSLLVGIHDLERGNEENLRDKTLQVFQPGGDKAEEQQNQQSHHLARTPSKMETAKRAKELREMVKKERPIPIDKMLDKMPEESHKSSFYFYADDGGFRATHEDDTPGEEIYYLGIIDCLTRYNYVKKAEHFWKGFGGHESQISPIPPDRYGDRFVKFISGITMSRERAEKERLSTALEKTTGIVVPPGIEGTVNDPKLGGMNIFRSPSNPPGTAEVMEKAEHMAEKSRRRGSSEDEVPDRSIMTVRTPPGDASGEAATLPVIGEAAESASSAPSRRVTPTPSHENVYNPGRRKSKPSAIIGNAEMTPETIGEVPPPTPPKMDGSVDRRSLEERASWGGRPPPTPPKDSVAKDFGGERMSRNLDKELPPAPEMQQLRTASTQLSASPARMGSDEAMRR